MLLEVIRIIRSLLLLIALSRIKDKCRLVSGLCEVLITLKGSRIPLEVDYLG